MQHSGPWVGGCKGRLWGRTVEVWEGSWELLLVRQCQELGMLGREGLWRCGHLGRVGGCREVGFGQCWGLWVSECQVWVWEDEPVGWGLWGGRAGLWAQDWEDGEGSHGVVLGQGGPGAREECGAVGLGMGEELGLWGWSWRKGGSKAVGLGVGTWSAVPPSLDTGCWRGGDTSTGGAEGTLGPIAGMF